MRPEPSPALPAKPAEAAAELRRLNERLSLTVFQLRNVLDVTRELALTSDEDGIRELLTSTLMGQLMVTRCALYLEAPDGLRCVHERGAGTTAPVFSLEEAAGALAALAEGARDVEDLPPGPLRDELRRARLALVVPFGVGDRVGMLAVGERPSRAPFGPEDRDFVETLARQAQSALTSVLLHRVQVQKQAQDREMQIAREIQQSLFPKCCPVMPGFEVAAQSRACYEVGGDHYDFIPLGEDRLAVTVADVSGKGAPASILMASVHASLRALAGTAPLPALMGRLNRFLFESTQTNRYVTLFYGELDAGARRFRYVNAGHVPPWHLGRGGEAARLTTGGPVLGLLEDARFEEGEARLESGDLLAMVTDGVTEALSEDEQEFGDDRVAAALGRQQGRAAEEALQGLLAEVSAWTGAAGCADDLTAVLVAAR